MAYIAKSAFLSTARRCGAFEFASRKTNRSLRILCYHGISIADEHELYPGTFMRGETFRSRMELLRDWGANVLPLHEGMERLKNGNLPDKAVVLTVDDGWYGTYSTMWPVLEEFRFPATLYACTYYMQKQGFVFNLFLDYAFKRAGPITLPLSEIDSGLEGKADLRDDADVKVAIGRVQEYGENQLTHEGRQELCYRLAERLGLDAETASKRKVFHFMDLDALTELSNDGLDIQLHTHTHRFSGENRDAASGEIEKNLAVLDGIGVTGSRHFCYPSGQYVADHSDWLAKLGIASATTTDFGLADPGHSPYFLPRICDSDAMGELDFMGAVSGFKTLLRT